MTGSDLPQWNYRRACLGVAFCCAVLVTAAGPAAASIGGGAQALIAAPAALAPGKAASPSCGRIELAQAGGLCCRNGVLHQRTTVGGRTTITRVGGACPAGTPPC